MGLRILLADDHELIRVGIRTLLEKRSDVAEVHEAADGRTAVRLAQELSPDLVILDVSMPELNGLETARRIREFNTSARVIILSMHSDAKGVASAFMMGALAYVLKDCAAVELADAIEAVMQGKEYISPRIAGAVVSYLSSKPVEERGDAFRVLTKREREVLQLLAEGKTSKEIGAILSVSPKTVETHRASLMNKLNVHSTAQLTKYAIREKITYL